MTNDPLSWEEDPETGSMPLAIIEACAVGVLVCRGFEEKVAWEIARSFPHPHPGFPIIELFKEVSSVILTLKAHGMLVGGRLQ